MDDPGPEITVELVDLLQNRINDAMLEVLSVLLARNPNCKLTYADVRVSFGRKEKFNTRKIDRIKMVKEAGDSRGLQTDKHQKFNLIVVRHIIHYPFFTGLLQELGNAWDSIFRELAVLLSHFIAKSWDKLRQHGSLVSSTPTLCIVIINSLHPNINIHIYQQYA